jgi:hypothetical protein
VNRHDGFKCGIEDGVLTIRLGIEVLAKAAKLNPELAEHDEDAEPEDEWVEPEIVDADKFAEEVLQALQSDAGNPHSLLEEMLDCAIVNAIEWGADGIKMPDQIIQERKKSE